MTVNYLQDTSFWKTKGKASEKAFQFKPDYNNPVYQCSKCQQPHPLRSKIGVGHASLIENKDEVSQALKKAGYVQNS